MFNRPASLPAGALGLWKRWARGVGSSGVKVGGGSGVLAWGGVPVLVLLVGVPLPGLRNGLLFLLAQLGWGGRGIQGMCSIRVGFGDVAGILVLRSLWGALGFGRFPAWGALSRGVVSVLVLWVGVFGPGLWGVLLSLLSYLYCWGCFGSVWFSWLHCLGWVGVFFSLALGLHVVGARAWRFGFLCLLVGLPFRGYPPSP